MPEKVMPGPVSDASGVREAVCVHTKKIMDACRDKDCVEDLRVWLTKDSQAALDRACSVKAACATLLHVNAVVEPMCYNRGFYTVDVRYFYQIEADAFVGAARPVRVDGLAVFDKRIALFGGEGCSKTFTSDMASDCPDLDHVSGVNQPLAVVEAVDPMVLALKLVDPCECKCECCSLCDVPACVLGCFGDDLALTSGVKRLFVSLGQFSLIRLERDTQLLIPVYDYCLPEKECACEGPHCDEDPCELFRRVKFPVEQFFPAPRPAGDGDSCGCCG